MILWGLAWKTQIPLTFIVFLVLSAYHFGEGDLDYIQLKRKYQTLIFLSRGSYILSLAILSKPHLTMEIVERFINVRNLKYSYQSVRGIMITQHFLILMIYGSLNLLVNLKASQLSRFPVIRSLPTNQVWIYEICKAGLFYALFKSMNPLVAFCLYLGPWHSVGHMLSEISSLKIASNPSFSLNKKVNWSDIAQFLYLTTPFTLIALSSMTGAYLLTFGLNSITVQDINAWSVFVISISVLTGPHLWVVAAMHSEKVNLDPLNIERGTLMVSKTFGLG